MSHPVRGAWIEIVRVRFPFKLRWSHPVRGAWIEIVQGAKIHFVRDVAPRQGCVD